MSVFDILLPSAPIWFTICTILPFPSIRRLVILAILASLSRLVSLVIPSVIARLLALGILGDTSVQYLLPLFNLASLFFRFVTIARPVPISLISLGFGLGSPRPRP